MTTLLRFAGVSALVLIAACGEPVVGTSDYANTPPIVEPIPDVTTLEDVPAMTALSFVDEEDLAAIDVSFESSNPALIDETGITVTGSPGTNTIVLVPKPNANGTATITVTLVDTLGHVDPVVLEFRFVVTPVNDLPTFSGLAGLTIDEDTSTGPQSFSVADIDDDVATVTVTATADDTTLVPTVTLTPGATPGSYTWSVTPPLDGNGSAVLTFVATDSGGTTTETLTLTVTPVNDAPTIGTIANVTTAEDVVSAPATAFTIGDVDDAPATLTLTASSSNPTVVPNANVVFGGTGANRTLTVLSAPDQFGSATITVTVSDGRLSATTTFDVTITPVNDPPVISAVVNQSTDEDTAVPTITVTVSDVDDAVGTLVLTGASSNTAVVANAGIVLAGTTGTRTVDISPVANAFGTTTITLTIRDPSNLTDTSAFDVVVSSVNDQPTFTSTVGNTATNEDTQTAALGFVVADVETAPAALVVTATSSDPSVVAPGGIAIASVGGGGRTIRLTPVANAFGSTTITVTVDDGSGAANATNTFTFVLTVNSQNDLPVISVIADPTIEEDTTTGALAFTVTDVETPAGGITVGAASQNSVLVDASGVVLGGTAPNHTITITPIPDQNGDAQILITATDSDGGVSQRTFTVHVTPQNDPPEILIAPNASTNEDTAITGYTVTIRDVDNTMAQVTLTATNSSVPTVVAAPGGFAQTGSTVGPLPSEGTRTFTITPVLNAFGTTTITLTASDLVESTTRTFTITVNSVNDLPTISAIANFTVLEDASPAPFRTFTIGDVETLPDDLILSATSTNTTLLPNAGIAITGTGANRTITLTIPANAYGSTSVTITVTDADSASASEPFVLTVTSVNDLPTITALAGPVTINEDGSTPLQAFTIGDIETPLCALTVAGTSTNTAIVAATNFTFGGSCAARDVVVSPALNANGGPITITVTVTDADGGTATATFSLTVTPVNDAPVVSAVANQTTNEDTAIPGISVTVTDPDGPTGLSLGATSGTTTVIANAGLVVTGTASPFSLAVTPVAEASGASVITLTAFDGFLSSAPVTFTVTVNVVDDPPVISAIANATIDEDDTTGAIAFTVTDVDSDAPTLVVTSGSGNTTLLPNANVVLAGAEPNFTVTATPVANGNGSSVITITAQDATSTVTRTFTVVVDPVNDLPTIGLLADLATNEDTATGAITLVIDDTEDGCVGLTLSATSSVGTIVNGTTGIVFAGTCPSRTVTLTPIANANGPTTITITVTDTDAATASEPFVLTVDPIADPPIAVADTFATTGNVSIGSVSVAGNDSDPDLTPLTFAQSGASTHGGIVTMAADGTFSYTPPPGRLTSVQGDDTFTYDLTSGGDTVQGTVTITIGLPMRWYVNNAAPSPGTTAGDDGGTDVHPFATLAEVQAEPLADEDDWILVYYGNGTNTGYAAGIVLDDRQQLLGVRQLAAPNNPPSISNTGGPVVTTANGNIIRDLALSTGTSGIFANGLGGSLTVSDVAITSCPTGFFVDGTSTTAALVNLTNVTVAGASAAGANLTDASFTASGTTSFAGSGGNGLTGNNVVFGGTVSNVTLTGSSSGAGIRLTNTTNDLVLGSLDVDVTGTADGVVLDNGDLDVGASGSTLRIATDGVALRANATSSLKGTIATFDCVSSGDNCIDLQGTALALVLEDFLASTTINATPVYLSNTSGSFVIDDAANGRISTTSNRRLLFLDDVDGADIELRSINGSPTQNESSIQVTNSPAAALLVNGDNTGARNGSGGTITASAAVGSVIQLDDTATATFRSMNITTSGNNSVDAAVTEGAGATFEGCSLDGGAGGGGRCVSLNTNASGSVRLLGSALSSAARLVEVTVSGTGTPRLVVDDTTAATSTMTGGTTECIYVANTASTTTTVDIDDTAFSNCGTDAAVNVQDTSAGALVFSVDGSTSTTGTATGNTIYVNTAGGGAETIAVRTNTFSASLNSNVRVATANCNARNEVTVRGNTIGTFDVEGSGSVSRNGIWVSTAGANCTLPHFIENNTVYGVNVATYAGIRLEYAVTGTSPSNIEIHGNLVNTSLTSAAAAADSLYFTTTGATGTCFDIDNNNLHSQTAAGTFEVNGNNPVGAAANARIEGWTTNLQTTILAPAAMNTLSGSRVNSTTAFVAGTCPVL